MAPYALNVHYIPDNILDEKTRVQNCFHNHYI